MSAVKRLAAYWDWPTGAAVPDARIVVCAPGTYTKHLLDVYGRHQASDESGNARPYVVPFLWSTETPPYWFIPAIHVTHQADLARLPDLLAVKAERRALVVSPEETIDLDPLVCEEHGEAEIVNGDDGATPFCSECPSGEDATEMGSAGYLDDIDVVFIVGLDKPMAPAWVRSIVEQCRKAGVPVVFVTWGSWLPDGQDVPDPNERELVRMFLEPAYQHQRGSEPIEVAGCRFLRMPVERSGALLDGAAVEDVPAWLDGAT